VAVFQLGEMYSFFCVGCRLFMLKRFVSGSTQLGMPGVVNENPYARYAGVDCKSWS